MIDKNVKARRLKVMFIVSISSLLITSIVIVFLYLTGDISEKELGPSPFQFDESLISENNIEYQKIIKIGKKIIGTEKFEKDNYHGYIVEEPQKAILILQDYINTNKGLVENVDIELFKKCKFPKWNIYDDFPMEGIANFQKLLKLMRYRIELFILTKDINSAKNELVLLNNICEELIQKPPTMLHLLVFKPIKSSVIYHLATLINCNEITIEDKIELLNIEFKCIKSKTLKHIFHFEIQNLQETIKMLEEPISKRPKSIKKTKYYPIDTSFNCQPNKTTKLLRTKALSIISLIETPTNASILKLKNRGLAKVKAIEFFEGNIDGKKAVEEAIPMFNHIASSILKYNNLCNQLMIAQKLLTYKRDHGSFPLTLSDLKVDPKLFIDINTDSPFLYSSENGILQSIGDDKINESLILTTKILSPKEIQEILIHIGRDFILFLK